MKKKPLMLLVCRLLETETDSKHFLTQIKIADILSQVYPCDRKTVGRDISILKEMGFPIVKTSKGYYMDRKRFSIEDIKFIEQAILTASGKEDEEKAILAQDVATILGKSYFAENIIASNLDKKTYSK